jgi:hypothetical protein
MLHRHWASSQAPVPARDLHAGTCGLAPAWPGFPGSSRRRSTGATNQMTETADVSGRVFQQEALDRAPMSIDLLGSHVLNDACTVVSAASR